jgi:hypothetical protein
MALASQAEMSTCSPWNREDAAICLSVCVARPVRLVFHCCFCGCNSWPGETSYFNVLCLRLNKQQYRPCCQMQKHRRPQTQLPTPPQAWSQPRALIIGPAACPAALSAAPVGSPMQCQRRQSPPGAVADVHVRACASASGGRWWAPGM